jgi:fructose-specific phosphotransferase system IIC component
VLKPEASVPQQAAPWYQRNPAGIAAVVVGFVSLIAAFAMQFGGHKFDPTHLPDVRVTIPLLAVAAIAGAASFVRKEPLRPLPIAGVGMAAAALALGWIIVASAVAVVSLLVIVLIAKFH